MKTIYLSIYSILILIASLFFMVGCTDEDQTKNKSNKLEYPVNISLKIPSTEYPRNGLRSSQIEAETRINELQVLVFEDGNYAYKVVGENISQTDDLVSLRVRLRASSVPTILYFIANNNAMIDLDEPAVGTPINQVETRFTSAFSNSGIAANNSLWGSYTVESGIGGSLPDPLDEIQLLRAVARVDVIVSSAVSNFRLQTIQVFRAANRIQVIPNSPNSALSVTTPSVPAGTLYNVTTTAINTTSATASTAQIYLPESVSPALANQVSSATCIVLGGIFNNGSTTRFYRLDFDPGLGSHPAGQVLRNCRYVYSINGVNTNGFATALEAANNPALGMGVEAIIWPGDNFKHMYFDNTNFFAMERNEVVLLGNANATVRVGISTDVSSYFIRFSDGIPTAWGPNVSDASFRITQADGGATLVFTALTNNPSTGAVRRRVIQVRAGNITPITVPVSQIRQGDTPP